MLYRTKNFNSPTGGVKIFAEYNETSKELVFQLAKGYLYPQDSNHMRNMINVEQFIENHSAVKGTVEEANDYLAQLMINEALKEI